MLLTKHYFRENPGAFGLFEQQMRSGPDKVKHNASWYNKRGEKVGWGDLSAQDFKTLAAGLPAGDFFITIPEGAGFWDLKEALPDLEDYYAPGLHYVMEHATHVVTKDRVLRVVVWGDETDRHGFQLMPREQVLALVEAG